MYSRPTHLKHCKLLGVHVSNDLKWTQHINAISSKVAPRLHFSKLLERSGVPLDDLLCLCQTVLRPVLKHACPVRHSSLTTAQSKALGVLAKKDPEDVRTQRHGEPPGQSTHAGLETL